MRERLLRCRAKERAKKDLLAFWVPAARWLQDPHLNYSSCLKETPRPLSLPPLLLISAHCDLFSAFKQKTLSRFPEKLHCDTALLFFFKSWWRVRSLMKKWELTVTLARKTPWDSKENLWAATQELHVGPVKEARPCRISTSRIIVLLFIVIPLQS